MRTPHRRSSLAIVPLAMVLLVGLAAPATAAVTYSTNTPFSVWEVQEADIDNIGGRANILVKAFHPNMNIVRYLDTAKTYGFKVIVYFQDTVDYNAGTVYPTRVKPWVDKVKTHPALYGYMSVKEPSWWGVTLSEMRSLYSAYRAADSGHPVIALLGDTPHFGTSANPWGTGVANELWVDWYPVTYSRGYIPNASIHFPKIRSYVDKVTPGTPITLSVQGHGNRAGDKRTPTVAEMTRQVRDGFVYLKANGISFYTWNNTLYDKDLKRNPTLWGHCKTIVARVRGGTF